MTSGLLFTAYFEYFDGDRAAVSTTIDFRDRGADMAIYSAKRWWESRHEAAPEWFAELLCLKIGFLNIGNIDEKGRLPPRSGGDFFEYKIDAAGMPFAEYVDYRVSRMWAERRGKPVRTKKGRQL